MLSAAAGTQKFEEGERLFTAEFGEDAESAFGVEETNMKTFGAGASLLVDEPDTLCLGIGESSIGVLDSESDVVHTAAAAILFDERGDSAFGAGRFEEFDFDLTAFEESGTDLLVGDLFDSVAFEAHNIFPIADSFVKIGNSDTNVFDV